VKSRYEKSRSSRELGPRSQSEVMSMKNLREELGTVKPYFGYKKLEESG
jgi:hypothetical protein